MRTLKTVALLMRSTKASNTESQAYFSIDYYIAREKKIVLTFAVLFKFLAYALVKGRKYVIEKAEENYFHMVVELRFG